MLSSPFGLMSRDSECAGVLRYVPIRLAESSWSKVLPNPKRPHLQGHQSDPVHVLDLKCIFKSLVIPVTSIARAISYWLILYTQRILLMDNSTTAVTASNGVTTEDGQFPHRPRDTRLIHSLLASQSVSAYQERVPLMLIDFAYRYTRSILSDAATLSAEGYGAPTQTGRGAALQDDINLTSLRLAVASRQVAQFQPILPKADLLEMAQETNRVSLPRAERDFGLRLPNEKYLLTGTGFSLQEEWDEEESIEEEEEEEINGDKDEVMMDGDEGEGGLLDDEDMEQDEFEEVMGVNQDKQMTDV
jgi:transcription initiation factor TFIID subunit 9B